MNVSPMDLRQQRFHTTFRGFDKVEVTALLAAVAEDYEQALRETDRLRQELSSIAADEAAKEAADEAAEEAAEEAAKEAYEETYREKTCGDVPRRLPGGVCQALKDLRQKRSTDSEEGQTPRRAPASVAKEGLCRPLFRARGT